LPTRADPRQGTKGSFPRGDVLLPRSEKYQVKLRKLQCSRRFRLKYLSGVKRDGGPLYDAAPTLLQQSAFVLQADRFESRRVVAKRPADRPKVLG